LRRAKSSARETAKSPSLPRYQGGHKIAAGEHVHTHNVETMLSEAAEYHYDEARAKEYADIASEAAAK